MTETRSPYFVSEAWQAGVRSSDLPDGRNFAALGEDTVIYDPHLSIFVKPEHIRIGRHARIDGNVKLEGGDGLEIGDYVHLASFCHLNAGGGRLRFGSHSGCAAGVVIASGMPDLSYLHICPNDVPPHHAIHKHTVIGEYVVIFANAVVTPGVMIGDGAVVGAGSVVTTDVPEFEIWAGCPAHKIGERKLHDSELQRWMDGEGA